MDKRLSEKILQYFDFKTIEVLKEYISDRKDSIHSQMEIALDSDQWKKLQGNIQELNQLEKLRDHALAIIERDRNA